MKTFAAALLAALAFAGLARAEDEDAKWRRLEAQAAAYNASPWVRLEAADGRFVWVRPTDASKLVKPHGRPRRVVALWPDSVEYVPHVGDGTRYIVSDDAYDCGRKMLTEHRWFFHADGSLLAERLPEPGEFTEDDILYQAVCKGLPLKESRRWPSAAAVIANEPDEGADPPAQ